MTGRQISSDLFSPDDGAKHAIIQAKQGPNVRSKRTIHPADTYISRMY